MITAKPSPRAVTYHRAPVPLERRSAHVGSDLGVQVINAVGGEKIFLAGVGATVGYLVSGIPVAIALGGVGYLLGR